MEKSYIDPSNDSLLTATIYFYLESEPTEGGSFSYYGNDDSIAIWVTNI